MPCLDVPLRCLTEHLYTYVPPTHAQTNALASFVLTTQLTPLMRNARHVRVVNLASDTGLPVGIW